MPFKLRLIKQFQKCMKDSNQLSNHTEASIVIPDKEFSKNKNKSKKKLVSKTYNLYQYILKQQMHPQFHIANFYNIIGINELAIRQQPGQQSYFKNLFYIKNIKKIEIREKYLLITLSQSPLTYPPIQLILERYQSYGDAKFNRLANLMVEAALRLRTIQSLQTKPGLQDSAEFIEKYAESLSNKIYVFRTASNKIVLSKALLELLQFDPEEFAIQSIKYRAIMYEPASTEYYYEVIVKYLQNLSNVMDLISDRISLEAFLDNSVIRFRDTFYTKRNKKLYCKVKVGMPSPLVNIFQVEQVISKSDLFQNLSTNKIRNKYAEEIKQNIYSSEIRTVRSLLKLPKNLLPQNLHLVTNYQFSGQQIKQCQNQYDC